MSHLTGWLRVRTVAIALAATAVLLAAVGAAGAAPTHRSSAKAITLTIGANAVVGGKNDLEASWVTNYIIPNFEKQMAAAGDPVDVRFQGTGVADEAYKTQLALDLKTGGGADIVVHSTTKYLNGHSDVVGGAVVAAPDRTALTQRIQSMNNLLGTSQSPHDAFLVEPGMRIAQLVVVPVPGVAALEVAALPESERGERGFGSSAA